MCISGYLYLHINNYKKNAMQNEYTQQQLKAKYPHMAQFIRTQDDVDLINQAPGYHRMRWTKISRKHWDHLVKKLEIHDLENDDNDYGFFLNLSEGSLFAFIGDDYVTVWIWVDTEVESEYSANSQLWNKVLRHTDFAKIGLITALDPNEGGSMDIEYKKAASLIIFG